MPMLAGKILIAVSVVVNPEVYVCSLLIIAKYEFGLALTLFDNGADAELAIRCLLLPERSLTYLICCLTPVTGAVPAVSWNMLDGYLKSYHPSTNAAMLFFS